MGGEWTPTRLGDVTDLLTGYPFSSTRYIEDPHAPRLVRGDNVVQGALRWDGVKRWPSDSVGELAAYELREGDVVLAMDRPWIEAGLKYAPVRADDLPALLVQRVSRLRGMNGLDTGFLKYLIGSQRFTDYVLGVQTGTAVPHISGGQIRAFEFRMPPLAEQRAIAHILGTLDDKIELNRRMNETLEAMARALFKSWFVDFDPVRAKMEGRWRRGESLPGLPAHLYDLFPDRLVDSDLGEIPEGWEVGALGDVLSQRVERCTPSDETKSRPYVPIDCIAARSLLLADAKPAEEAQSSLTRFRKGDLLFGAMRPYFHKVAIAPFDGTTRTTVFVLFPHQQGEFAYSALLLHDPRTIEYATNHSTGSTIPYAVWQGSLEFMPIVLPPRAVRTSVEQLARPLLSRIPPLFFVNRTLGNLRDALLPKLISGELRVELAERVLEPWAP
jgi:type I restriction enzyme S subunit